MALHQITHRHTGEVLFECNIPDNFPSSMRARHALEVATTAGANLTGAYLTDANLTGANLTGANLTGANLTGANLTDANLTGANLTDAYLTVANLTGADLTDAYLTDAAWGRGAAISLPPIQISGLRWFISILDTHMQIGCECHPLADWASFDDARIAKMDGKDALRFWREQKDSLLSIARAAGRGAEKDSKAEAAA